MVEVSIILPIFNAERIVQDNIKALHRFLCRYYQSFEIIAVDDGSSDGTAARLGNLDLPGLHVVRLDKNLGKGNAVACGMREAHGRCRIFTDIDLPYELTAIPVCTGLINDRQFHVVAGDRTLPGSNYYDQVGRFRAVGSRLFATVIRLAVTGEMYDTQCGLKAFRDDIARELFPMLRLKDFSFDVEILYIALKYNMEIRRIPVRYRPSSRTSVRPLHDGLSMLFSVARLPWYYRQGAYDNERLRTICWLRYWEQGETSLSEN